MPARLGLKFIDHGREKSTAEFRGVTLTAANFNAQVALQDALSAAVQDITLGNLNQLQRVVDQTDGTNAAPASQNAQRERKFLVSFEDNVNFRRHTLELPTADNSLLIPNTDELNITAGAGQAWKDAFEAFQLSPDGNSVTVLKVVHVGRNL